MERMETFLKYFNAAMSFIVAAGTVCLVWIAFHPTAAAPVLGAVTMDGDISGWAIALFVLAISMLLTLWSATIVRWYQKWHSPLTKVESQIFKDKIVEVDGNYFHKCKFENITFRYRGGRFFFDRSEIVGTRRVELVPFAAFGAIELFKLCGCLTDEAASSWVSLPPESFK